MICGAACRPTKWRKCSGGRGPRSGRLLPIDPSYELAKRARAVMMPVGRRPGERAERGEAGCTDTAELGSQLGSWFFVETGVTNGLELVSEGAQDVSELAGAVDGLDIEEAVEARGRELGVLIEDDGEGGIIAGADDNPFAGDGAEFGAGASGIERDGFFGGE